MNNIFKVIVIAVLTLFVSSCEKDSKNGNTEVKEFIVAFEEQSYAYSDIKDAQEVPLLFSDIAMADGSVEIDVRGIDASYGVDFATVPAATNGKVVLPFKKGDRGVSFTFQNLIYPFDRTDKTVQFIVTKVNYALDNVFYQGYEMMTISFNASLGGVLSPDVGGPSEPNQVYVSLGGKAMYTVRRDSWDLAFYNGDDFVVKLNSSVYMAAGSTGKTQMEAVNEANTGALKLQVAIGTFEASNLAYIDDPSGSLYGTAIAKIDSKDINNQVYLVNLGSKPGDGKAGAGSVDIEGAKRGWKKIRILRKEGGYLLQYADVNSAVYQEVSIPKQKGANFQFFSFDSNKLVTVEPSKDKWDLNFTVFTASVDQNGVEKGSYGFSDYVLHNRYGGVRAYRVETPDADPKYFKDFKKTDIEENKFSEDLRAIGATWREVVNYRTVYKNIFYVLKDANGNYYKIRFLNYMSETGVRGNPKFQYQLIYE